MKSLHYLVIVAILSFLIYGCRGAKKYKKAYIEKSDKNFIITLRGRGTGHPSGFSDVFFPKTFEDSIGLLSPISSGNIKYNNVLELYPSPPFSLDTATKTSIFTTISFDTIRFSKG